MSRVQLAINVSDLDSSIAFYSKLLSAEPAKVQPGYANFVVNDPPLKLVLIEQGDGRGSGVVGALNHLGVEVETTAEVIDSANRLSDQGMATDLREGTTCCYALQDKVWVDDPDLVPWEIYTVLADSLGEGNTSTVRPSGAACVGPLVDGSTPTAAPHCC
jgi:catechol 2,3-dioxygenase-like lactoylglutathione lyase family enzyme